MAQMPDLNVVCKNCGNEVSPYITECPYCGTRLRKRAPEDRARRHRLRAAQGPQGAASPRAAAARASAPTRSPASAATHRAAPTRRSRWSSLSLFGYLLLFPSPLVDVARRRADPRRVVARRDLARSSTRASGTSWPPCRPIGDLRLAAGAPPRAARRARALRRCAGWAASRWPWPSIDAVAFGGNGAALGLLCAWAVPDLHGAPPRRGVRRRPARHGGVRRRAAAHAAGRRPTRARSRASRAARRACWPACCWPARRIA